jgi:hypothetical protein
MEVKSRLKHVLVFDLSMVCIIWVFNWSWVGESGARSKHKVAHGYLVVALLGIDDFAMIENIKPEKSLLFKILSIPP